jgi:hypothetical protein
MKSVATLLFSTFATFYGIITNIIARGACNTRPHKIPLNVKLTQAPHGLGTSARSPMRGRKAQDFASDRIKIAISFR